MRAAKSTLASEKPLIFCGRIFSNDKRRGQTHLFMTSLYVCYQSILEPLTRTQVVAYLEGLTKAGCRIVLLTFEPRRLTADEERDCRRVLEDKEISWHWLRYHKRPSLPATLWDVLCGTI